MLRDSGVIGLSMTSLEENAEKFRFRSCFLFSQPVENTNYALGSLTHVTTNGCLVKSNKISKGIGKRELLLLLLFLRLMQFHSHADMWNGKG